MDWALMNNRIQYYLDFVNNSAVYCIIALFGTCAYSRKNAFWGLTENAGAPILYTLRLTSMCLYSSRGSCSLRGACAKKCDKLIRFILLQTLLLNLFHTVIFKLEFQYCLIKHLVTASSFSAMKDIILTSTCKSPARQKCRGKWAVCLVNPDKH